MITQRDINQFFTILEVLANPEKAKAELEVIANLRKSLDEKDQEIAEKSHKAMAMVEEAKNIRRSAEDMKMEVADIVKKNNLEAMETAKLKQQLLGIAENQKQNATLLSEKSSSIAALNKDIEERLAALKVKEEDYNTRMAALREQEAAYQEKVKKLKAIV